MFAKIKIIDTGINNYGYGTVTEKVFDAAISDNGKCAAIFIQDEINFYLNPQQFQILEMIEQNKKQNTIVSLAELLGQQVKTIEFK
jgi:hypothetical protein